MLYTAEAGNTSLRNAAAKFVAARFAKNQEQVPLHSAARIESYSTVTVSGASSEGLDRCAYTLGKWQHTQPASNNGRKRHHDDLDSHFPGIKRKRESKTAADTAAREETVSMSDNNDAVATESTKSATTDSVANFADYAKQVTSNNRIQTPVDSDKPSEKPEIENGERLVTASKGIVADATEQVPLVRHAANASRYISEPDKSNEYSGVERRSAVDRREFSIKTLVHCARHPQRAKGRRKTDARYPLLDVFDGSAMFLAVALTALSLCDAFFTLNILAHGGQEINPFMNYMLGYGTFAFVASKMFFTAVAVVVLTGAGNFVLFKRIRVRSVLAILTGLYAGLIVYELLILAMV